MALLTLTPPLVALILVVWRRDVILALVGALWVSETLLQGFNPGHGAIDVVRRVANAALNPYNAKVLAFCLLVGGLIAIMERSGGVAALVRSLTRRGIGPKGAGAVTAGTGAAIFIDTNLSLFSSALVGRPLFDRLGLSRARLAYIIDSTCAPISVLILINGWGAYALGFLNQVEGLANPVAVLAATIPLNFYALMAVTVAFFTAVSGRAFGPLARAGAGGDMDAGVLDAGPEPTKARYMWAPIAILLAGVPLLMIWTGQGRLFDGDGALSVLLGVSAALVVAMVMVGADRVMGPRALVRTAGLGVVSLWKPVLIILLSMALGDSLGALGTGSVIADALSGVLPVYAVAALVFVITGAMAFATGTSWGSYAIMFPLAMPLALSLGAPPALVAAAVLGGGVFGDHASPISDTTVIASLASGCDHFEHVRTQLPYALVLGGVAGVLYLVAGVIAAPG